jgi:hypothetical protein
MNKRGYLCRDIVSDFMHPGKRIEVQEFSQSTP